MFEQEDSRNLHNTLIFHIKEDLNDVDQAEINAIVNRRLLVCNDVRLVLFIDYPQRPDGAEFLYENLRFVLQHKEHISRMAVVGHSGRQETWVGLFGLFGNIEAAYFDQAETENALNWVQES